MGILGTVEDHEILAYLGGFESELSAEQLDEFKIWCKANPAGDWDTRARQMFADPAASVVKAVVEQHQGSAQVTISVTAPPAIPTLDEVTQYISGYGLTLGGEDFISFAAYCQAHPDGSWARMLQVIVGETEARPSPEHERCAHCHRWVYKVTSESGTNTGWFHQHTNTGDGQQHHTCGHSGELGAVGTPTSAVMTPTEIWATIANLVAAGAPVPRSVRVNHLRDLSPGTPPHVTITCRPGSLADVVAWSELLGIPKGAQARWHDESYAEVSYYAASPSISLMYPNYPGLAMMPGWEVAVRADITAAEMSTWAVRR